MRTILLGALLALASTARADLASDVASWTNGVYVAFIGDSITAGYPAYRPTSDGGPSGDTNANVASQLLTYSGGLVTATNRGVQGRVWGQMTYDVTNALKNKPRFVFVRCGINDISASNTWSQVESNANVVRSACIASNALLVIQDILPRTSGSDSYSLTIRTWNTNLTTWAATSGVRRVLDHDLFGTNRTSTGFSDNLYAPFDQDGIHLKPAAYPLWGRIAYTNLAGWMADPSTARAGSATIHHVTIR
jgi:lysophospholipase L1-like esterase